MRRLITTLFSRWCCLRRPRQDKAEDTLAAVIAGEDPGEQRSVESLGTRRGTGVLIRDGYAHHRLPVIEAEAIHLTGADAVPFPPLSPPTTTFRLPRCCVVGLPSGRLRSAIHRPAEREPGLVIPRRARS